MKKCLSALFVVALVASLCLPASASYVNAEDELVAALTDMASDSIGVLTTDSGQINLLPSKAEVTNLDNGEYCAAVSYDIELLDSIGSGSESQPGVDIAAGATVTVYIYFDRMVEGFITFVRLTRVAVNIDWTDDQIVLRNVGVKYECSGMLPLDEGSGTRQFDEYNFPISGHYYSRNTGFTDYVGIGQLNYICSCTAEITFGRGAASQWDFSVTCAH